MQSLENEPFPAIILLTGYPSGAGQTKVAEELSRILNTNQLHMGRVNRNLADLWNIDKSMDKTWEDFKQTVEDPEFDLTKLLEYHPSNDTNLQIFTALQDRDPKFNEYCRKLPEIAVAAKFRQGEPFILQGDLAILFELISHQLDLGIDFGNLALPIIKILLTVDETTGIKRVLQRMNKNEEKIYKIIDGKKEVITDPDEQFHILLGKAQKRNTDDYAAYENTFGVTVAMILRQPNTFTLDTTHLTLNEVIATLLTHLSTKIENDKIKYELLHTRTALETN